MCVAGRRPGPLEALAAEIGGHAVVADVADPAGPAAAVAGAVERFGRLDALVCCAGTGAGGTAVEQTLERWDRVLATNLTGVFLTCQAALPHLIETRGAIVTVASLAGLRAAPASAAYGASKAGAIMLTQCIAVDHGPQRRPGQLRVPGVDPHGDGRPRDGRARRPARPGREGAYELATAPVPARRPGEPGEVARPRRAGWPGPQSTYVNGAVVTVDGGSAVVDAASLAFGP